VDVPLVGSACQRIVRPTAATALGRCFSRPLRKLKLSGRIRFIRVQEQHRL
jgi:hypothetical protein